MAIQREHWGTTPDGLRVDTYALRRPDGREAVVCTLGASLLGLTAPDRDGKLADVVLAPDGLEGMLRDSCYMGRMVGRVANRIAQASFVLEGVRHELDPNLAPHHHHGGGDGFHARVWDATAEETADGPRVTFHLTSPDGDQGYPGTLEARATYTLTDKGLRLETRIETDRPTVASIANHAYFHLGGHDAGDIGDHEVVIHAARCLATDEDTIPTGAFVRVADTDLDFITPRAVGPGPDTFPSLETVPDAAHGYDHYYVLDRQRTGDEGGPAEAARLRHPASGRELVLRTTQPGLQFYTGNFLPAGMSGKHGAAYGPRTGLCLEPHGYPDAPNHEQFPSIALRPGEIRAHTTEYLLGVAGRTEEA